MLLLLLSDLLYGYRLTGHLKKNTKGLSLHSFLLITVAKCCYLSLPVSADQCIHFQINRTFLPEEPQLSKYIFLPKLFFINSAEMLCMKNKRSGVSETLKPARLVRTTKPWGKSLRSHIFPYFDVWDTRTIAIWIFFGQTILYKLCRMLCMKNSRDQVFLKPLDQRIWYQQLSHGERHWDHIFPSSWFVCARLCCTDATWLIT